MSKGPRFTATAITTVIALILLVPLCGGLFDCGCIWPWAGGSEHCNFYSHPPPLHCPWCEYPFVGTVSVALAICSGVTVSWRVGAGKHGSWHPMPWASDQALRNFLSLGVELVGRTLGGVGTFVLTAAVLGWLVAIADL